MSVRVLAPPSTLRRLKAAAGARRTGVRVAQQTPHNLVDRPDAVFAAGVAATATCLFAEELRPPHQTTVSGARVRPVSMRFFSCPSAVEEILAPDCLAVLSLLDLHPGGRLRRVVALACFAWSSAAVHYHRCASSGGIRATSKNRNAAVVRDAFGRR